MNIQIDYQTLNASSRRSIERQYPARLERKTVPRMIRRIIATVAIALLAFLLVAQVSLPIELTNEVVPDQHEVNEASIPMIEGPHDEASEATSGDVVETFFLGEAQPLDPNADLSNVTPSMDGSGGGFLIK